MSLSVAGTTRLYGTGGSGGQITAVTTFPGADITQWTLAVTGADIKEIRTAGAVTSLVISSDWTAELTITGTFQGAGTAALPAAGATSQHTGFPSITIGSVSDALNKLNWYFASANLTAISDDAASGTATFKGYATLSHA